jgi:hypothetical protein
MEKKTAEGFGFAEKVQDIANAIWRMITCKPCTQIFGITGS